MQLTKTEEKLSDSVQAFKKQHNRSPDKVKVSPSIFTELRNGAIGDPTSIVDTIYTPNTWNIVFDKELKDDEIACE